MAFARGLLSGAFRPEDLDPRHPHHTGWLAQVCTILATLPHEYQAWEEGAGIDAEARSQDAAGFAALDSVTRRG
ncbi:hypothetical protein [Gemmata sp.]|uniref:hypothetical protein n=1 Tax=Gemmata sp. TaxID=1914242 RepID=UPI003F709CFE